MRRRVTATLILTILSLVSTTIIAAGNMVSAEFDNGSIYPLTITLTGGPQDLNIVLGNTTTSHTANNIDTNINIGNEDIPFTQTTFNQDSFSMLSGPTITNTLSLSETPGGLDDTFTRDIVTNTTTLKTEGYYSGTTPVSELADTSSTAVSTHSDKLAAAHTGIDTPASTTSSESIADDPAFDNAVWSDLESSAENFLTDEVSDDSEIADYTDILPQEDSYEATSTSTQDVTGTTVLSKETDILTTSASTTFTTIDITTETVSITGTEETGIPDSSLSGFLLENGLLAAMIFVSGIAAVLFVIVIIYCSPLTDEH
jgi:hypothetical protein